jgi:outer membrane protein assembly factor BamE (lipoprotein component of BamABCDE complex)
MRYMATASLALVVAGCSIQRAQIASDAKATMVGMTREQVFTCMGPPANKASEGSTEIWSYPSGNGYQSSTVVGSTDGTFNATRSGNDVYGTANTFGSATGVNTRRFCTVNVVLQGNQVSQVNYAGPTGGLLTAGEQCAFAVETCAKSRG